MHLSPDDTAREYGFPPEGVPLQYFKSSPQPPLSDIERAIDAAESALVDVAMAVDAAESEFLEVLESPCEEMIFDLAAQIRLLEDEISHRQARQLDRIEQQLASLWDAMKQLTSERASK